MTSTLDITQEVAARRFHQMASIERAIVTKISEINDCKAHLKELTDQREGLMLKLREAARNEGELPLFDFNIDESDLS
jgi:hypothetical protein